MNEATKQRLITFGAAGISYVLSQLIVNRFIDIPDERGIKDDALEAILKGATTASATILASLLVRKLLKD
ncbi:MAG: hypothetical protein ACR2GU_04395 [Rubrobacteraceae bacterium]